LVINKDKTELIIFSKEKMEMTMNNTIKSVVSIKVLGVLVDKVKLKKS